MLISATAPSTLSKTERDRRYVRLRSDLAERAVDATVVFGSNLFYLTNGLSGERAALFPTPDEPITVLINSRHLADIPVSVLRDAQDWVHDLRAGNDMSPLIERTRCLAGPSLVVTESGYRELGERTVEMLVLA